jgi:hypothetical protein
VATLTSAARTVLLVCCVAALFVLGIHKIKAVRARDSANMSAVTLGNLPPGPRALGINLSAVSYYSSEQPFLNIVKSGGSSSAAGGAIGWYTATGNTWDTKEEGYLQLDSDGYPTSLTASSTPPGGQQFTMVRTLVDYNQPTGLPGQTYTYPPGTYRLKFEGQGTVQVAGDAGYASGDTCPSSLALSNSGANTYVSCTFTVSNPSNGILLQITAVTNSSDHPRDISIVQNAYASNYDSGAIFNPAFTAMLSGFSSLRFMEWMDTNGELSAYSASGTVNSGATNLSLSSAWPYPSGSYSILFIDGEQRTATFTVGSTSVSWSGGLSNTISNSNNWTFGSQSYYATFYVLQKAWAHRSLPSNAFWSLSKGVPLEVIVALCNQLQTNCHVNVPLMYSDSDIQAMGQLVMSGTGMQSGYAALSSPLTASFELSNEVWNSVFNQYNAAGSLGAVTWPSEIPGGGNYSWNRNYFGMRTALMASDLQTAVGATLFARAIPVLAAQATTSSATDALKTTYWDAGPASKYPIKAVAIAPYWGNNPSPSDCMTMTGQSDGGLADFFATLTSQTGASGATYSSVPDGGWLGQTAGWITSLKYMMSDFPTMQLIAYEGGQNFFATTAGTCGGWPKLVTAAERDPRMGAAYTKYLAFWQTKVGGTNANVSNLFNDVTTISDRGAWGMIESIMQPITPLSASPPKYQAVMNYIHK